MSHDLPCFPVFQFVIPTLTYPFLSVCLFIMILIPPALGRDIKSTNGFSEIIMSMEMDVKIEQQIQSLDVNIIYQGSCLSKREPLVKELLGNIRISFDGQR